MIRIDKDIAEFVRLMDKFKANPQFEAMCDHLEHTMKDYEINCYKCALTSATHHRTHRCDYGFLRGLNNALENYLDRPFLSSTAIELNAWRLIVYNIVTMKLVELHAYFKYVWPDMSQLEEKDG